MEEYEKNYNDDCIRNLEFLYKVITERVNAEYQAQDIKDNKASLLLGFSSTLLSIIFSFSNVNKYSLLGIISIYISIIFAYLAYRVKSWRRDPDPEALWRKYRECNYTNTLETIIFNIVDSYKNNKERDNKSIYINIGYIFLIIGLGILIFSKL